MLEVVHSPSSGDLYAITRDNNNLFNGSAATGNMHLVCSGTLDEVKGVAFESGSMPRLLAVLSSGSSEDTDELFEIDLD